jgi:hypothetical protein
MATVPDFVKERGAGADPAALLLRDISSTAASTEVCNRNRPRQILAQIGLRQLDPWRP